MGISCDETDWHSVEDALLLLPECSGLFKLGLGSDDGGVDTVLISHTTEFRTLREMVTQVSRNLEAVFRQKVALIRREQRCRVS